MAKQRKIPFGYMMQDGRYTPHPDEAAAVRDIYSKYLAGSSYQHIAEAMCAKGIAYHTDKVGWNKHMVKRILENERYCGCDIYPAILRREDYQAARNRQKKTTEGWQYRAASIDMIRSKAVCAVCGKPIGKVSSTNGYCDKKWWHCSDTACDTTLITTDVELEQAATAILRRITAQPELLQVPEVLQPAISLELNRLNNDIVRELDRPQLDEKKALALILEGAAERYRVCPDDSLARQTAALRRKLEQRGRTEGFDGELFGELVEAVEMNTGGIALRLITGDSITLQKQEAV